MKLKATHAIQNGKTTIAPGTVFDGGDETERLIAIGAAVPLKAPAEEPDADTSEKKARK